MKLSQAVEMLWYSEEKQDPQSCMFEN